MTCLDFLADSLGLANYKSQEKYLKSHYFMTVLVQIVSERIYSLLEEYEFKHSNRFQKNIKH